MTGRLLTARQVADQLGLSTETVLRWARRGELPSMHLSNRAIRFREDELNEWLAARATGTGTLVDPRGGRAALSTPPARPRPVGGPDD